MIDRDSHQKWFESVVNDFKGLSPEVREIELSHLETALRDIPPKKKPGPKKGYKKGKVKGTKLPKPQAPQITGPPVSGPKAAIGVVDPPSTQVGPPEEQ